MLGGRRFARRGEPSATRRGRPVAGDPRSGNGGGNGAAEEIRTPDIDLGKVALYH